LKPPIAQQKKSYQPCTAFSKNGSNNTPNNGSGCIDGGRGKRHVQCLEQIKDHLHTVIAATAAIRTKRPTGRYDYIAADAALGQMPAFASMTFF
jgi:hypothetical protein